jgi:hypothetical protein
MSRRYDIYRIAIAWIAKHQASAITAPNGDHHGGSVAALDTVTMLSDVFGVNVEHIVDDVVVEHRRQTTKPIRSIADVRRDGAR